jgi:hypothetical protein
LCAAHFGNPRSGWILYQGQTGWSFRLYNQNGFNTSLNIFAGPAPAIGVWHHVVAVFNGTNGFVYVNGVLRTNAVAAGFVPDTDGSLTVGLRNDGNFPWGGTADEVAIYTNVLSAADVLAHYQNGTNAAPVQTYGSLILAANPLFYFRLDETNTSAQAANLGTAGPPYNGIYGRLSGATAVYAVSGLAVAAIALPALTNAPASGVSAQAATLGGAVVSTGGETPQVTLYYGPANGGTNAAAWSNNIALGPQTGAYSQTIGVSPNTTYYFTSQAVNSAGTNWATPSQQFTTPPAAPPVVANLPTTNVQATVATLNGQVVSTGNETTTVTVYFGQADGGTNAAAWSNSIPLGAQAGVFAQTVSGLAPNTMYFFACQAMNATGMNWAAPSQSFTTVGSNSASTAVAVLTQHNDNGRTGMNLNETVLNTGNVNTNSFGLLYSRPLDDQVYAQPLVMTNVTILGRGTRNIVIVATVNDTVYAFDADDPTVTTPYWTTTFINPPMVVVPNNADQSAIGACGGNYQDFSGKYGIVGAPVIDPNTETIYLLARTKEISGAGTVFVQRLHALDVATGAERPNSPVTITASAPGKGAGSAGGMIAFDPRRQNQRAALLLVNGTIYIAWTSHCDNPPYHGWVMAYDAATLQQLAVFNDTPGGNQAGIWMSNQGPAADADGNIYVSTGNGTFDAGRNLAESFLKLTRSDSNLYVASWFAPYNWGSLNAGDLDLGCGGVLLVPGTSLMMSGGKEGRMYVVNRDQMGGVSKISADTNAVQSWSLGAGEIHGGPVWWDSANGSFAYVWRDSADHLRQYQFTNGRFNTTPFALGPGTGGNGSCGGILSLSANGTNSASGIVWASINTVDDANQAVVMGTLHAYSAQNVTNELWNSDMAGPRDAIGKLAKFVAPTVANGKVYMATFSGRLNVYGLFPPLIISIQVSTNQLELTWPGTAQLQSATVVTGPYTTISNAVSPYFITPSNASQFFRLEGR